MGRTAEAISIDERPKSASGTSAAASTDGGPTERNVIPWSAIEQRLAERNAAKSAGQPTPSKPWTPDSATDGALAPWARDKPECANVPASPSSGVRPSTSAEPDLSYSVYTVADLEARNQARARARASRLPPTPEAQPSRWPDVKRSAAGLLRAFWRGWVRAKKRQRLLDVCTIPFQQLVTDAKIALRGVPWTKLATIAGVGVAALVVLGIAVLTTAELTDDLKPRSALASKSESLVEPPMEAMEAKSVEAEPVPAPEPPPDPAATIELEDAPAPAPAAKPVTRAFVPKSKKPGTLLVPTPTLKKRSGELFKP